MRKNLLTIAVNEFRITETNLNKHGVSKANGNKMTMN